jgi:hypothetical protein
MPIRKPPLDLNVRNDGRAETRAEVFLRVPPRPRSTTLPCLKRIDMLPSGGAATPPRCPRQRPGPAAVTDDRSAGQIIAGIVGTAPTARERESVNWPSASDCCRTTPSIRRRRTNAWHSSSTKRSTRSRRCRACCRTHRRLPAHFAQPMPADHCGSTSRTGDTCFAASCRFTRSPVQPTCGLMAYRPGRRPMPTSATMRSAAAYAVSRPCLGLRHRNYIVF